MLMSYDWLQLARKNEEVKQQIINNMDVMKEQTLVIEDWNLTFDYARNVILIQSSEMSKWSYKIVPAEISYRCTREILVNDCWDYFDSEARMT